MKKLMLFLLVFLFKITFSQTGPGGIGDNTGTSSLILWLDANKNTYTDDGVTATTNGSNLQRWDDLSGYTNHATQTIVARQPIWNTNVQNGLPSVYFNSADTNYLEYLGITLDPSTTDYSFFVALNSQYNAYSQIILQQMDGTGTGRSHLIVPATTNNPVTAYIGGVDETSGLNFTKSSFELENTIFNSNGASSTLSFFQNASFGGSRGGFTPESSDGYWITGINKTLSSFAFKGYISELILFNTMVNEAQRIIIFNYLSAKYNVALDSNDIYVNDETVNGDFDFDMAGIGRVDASNIQNDSQGGIVRILNPTNLGDLEFLAWGHNNGILKGTEITDVPTGVESRFDRVWRVNEVTTSGTPTDVGNIDLRWDLSGLGAVTTSDLRLLVDTNNDGLFADETPISGASSLDGNIYAFTGVSAITNYTRFTLGTINKTQTSLPITLLYFTAIPVNNEYIELKWQTATEINNDYFTIERSINGKEWNKILDVKGAGNSDTRLSYTAIDKSPVKGKAYYRLKQTDFNGAYTYSDMVNVNILGETNGLVNIYPNPAHNEITIASDNTELSELRIYNILGQDLSHLIIVSKENSNKLKVDITALTHGVYFIRTKNTVNTFTK